MVSKTASAGLALGGLPPVDETAITLKLRPLRRRDRFRFGLRWPLAAAAMVAGFSAGMLLFLDRPAPAPAPEPSAPETVVATPTPDPEPVLAAAVVPVLDPVEDIQIVDEELEEIVILDEPEPPPSSTRASRRAYARGIARVHTSRGQTALAMGDLTTAQRELATALTALPSHAPAAAAMAQLHLAKRRYGTALRLAKRASRAAPRKLEYMILLGDAHMLAGNRGAARKAWRKAAAYGSTKAEARLAR